MTRMFRTMQSAVPWGWGEDWSHLSKSIPERNCRHSKNFGWPEAPHLKKSDWCRMTQFLAGRIRKRFLNSKTSEFIDMWREKIHTSKNINLSEESGRQSLISSPKIMLVKVDGKIVQFVFVWNGPMKYSVNEWMFGQETEPTVDTGPKKKEIWTNMRPHGNILAKFGAFNRIVQCFGGFFATFLQLEHSRNWAVEADSEALTNHRRPRSVKNCRVDALV